MNAHVPILVSDHMQRLAVFLRSDRILTPDIRDEKTDVRIREAAEAVRGIVTVDLMRMAEITLTMRFPSHSWQFDRSTEGVTELMKALWREHDRLKDAMLDAADPAIFRMASQLYKAAKLCRQFKLEQISS